MKLTQKDANGETLLGAIWNMALCLVGAGTLFFIMSAIMAYVERM